MHINIELDFKNKNFLILGSVAILSLVLLITGAIYLAVIVDSIKQMESASTVSNYGSSYQTIQEIPADTKTFMLGAPAAAVALSALSFLVVLVSLSKYFKGGNELTSGIYFAQVFAMICLAIAFAITTQVLFEAWTKRNASETSLEIAAVNTFPTNIAFTVACGLGFIGGSYAHFKEQF